MKKRIYFFFIFKSSSIRKQTDFVKKQLGNTVNKRILQSNVKHQENMPFYCNSSAPNESYLPCSPSSSNQIQQMSNLTVNTNVNNSNPLLYSNQQQQKPNPLITSPVLMLNGQQNSSSNEKINLMNNSFASPANLPYSSSSNLSNNLSPQSSLVSPSNSNMSVIYFYLFIFITDYKYYLKFLDNSYMNQQPQKAQQQPFNFQQNYQGQVTPEYR